MATSDNGYVVLDDDTTGSQPRLRIWQLPGIRRDLALRDGSAGFLLVHLAYWFDAKIEQIDVGGTDDWGWSPRRISGTDRWSNHASGTAIDLNSMLHPVGVATEKTFSDDEIHAIHRRLRFYDGCIRWGGDYSSRPDSMHFEINAGLEVVEKKARSLAESPRGKTILKANPGAQAIIFS